MRTESSVRFTDTSGARGRRRTAATSSQISRVVEGIRRDPESRRHLVSAWNVSELERMAPFPPCHVLFQFYVARGRLSCQLYMRSADLFLGVPFNIASYSLLLLMIAQICDLEAGEFVLTLGDAHIYLNHLEQVETQLSREPHPLPAMHLEPGIGSLFDFRYEHFRLENYRHHPSIRAPIAV